MQKKLITVICIYLILQFITSNELSNYKSTNEIECPDSVSVLLKNYCYDCHSGETVYPLLSRLIPLNWLIHADVEKGRHVIDFGKWGNYNEFEQRYKQIAIAKELESDRMPPSLYRFFHRDKQLSELNRQILITYFKNESDSLKPLAILSKD
ncbi:MAG: heme-binding domain-containing protein [Calditrichaeota bacterium]|nr:heme-binding domain-containing protein [Calditrichota bacterium]